MGKLRCRDWPTGQWPGCSPGLVSMTGGPEPWARSLTALVPQGPHGKETAVIFEGCHAKPHRLGAYNNKNLFSCSSGGPQSEIRVSQHLWANPSSLFLAGGSWLAAVSPGLCLHHHLVLPVCLSPDHLRSVCAYVQLPLSCKDISPGPTLTQGDLILL